MSLSPRAAQWFELLVPRESLSAALGALAATHAVQLQARSEAAAATAPPAELTRDLAALRELRRRFGEWWPKGPLVAAVEGAEPRQRLSQALQRLQQWVQRAEPLVATLESIAADRLRLERLLRFLELAPPELARLDLLAQAGPRIQVRLWRLPGAPGPLPVPDGLLLQPFTGRDGGAFLLAVGAAARIDELQRSLAAEPLEDIPLPRWLPAGAVAAQAAVQLRHDALARQAALLGGELATVTQSTALGPALGDAAFVEWFATNVPQLEVSGHFAWVTGWIRSGAAPSVTAALRRAGVPQLLRLGAAPAGLEPPVTLSNPRWIAPFEFFVALLGTPGQREADPSAVLAVLAPLVFGCMFADVGQGAVLVVAGILLRRRFPALALLVPGGIASMAFGVLFGSVFAREDLLVPLWLRPLDRPLTVLAASLALGVGVLAAGLTIDAAGHAGCGLLGRWLRLRGGLALAYIGGVLAWWQPSVAGALIGAGAVAFVAGAAAEEPPGRRRLAAGIALGEFAEDALQLAVNTVSFLRVGAFALAHSGLSVAIVGLAAAISSRPWSLLMLVAGNLFVLLLEAMVVGIQTTRLVLFEFFIRFLKGTGRPFRPLPAAPMSKISDQGGLA